MDRWACVDAFSFPLQVLLSLHPEWLELPVAVLDRDHPRGSLLHLNKVARAARLQIGMRYGQALALVPHLRAEALDSEQLNTRADAIAETLQDFSPHVERDREMPGLFWLDASGLSRIYPTWQDWVEPLKSRLREEHQIYVAIVIGFHRFHTFAVARSTQRSGTFATPEDERREAEKIPLHKLGLSSKILKLTSRLGVHTVGDFLELPPEGLRRRLGPRAYRLYRLATGDLKEPLSAFHLDEVHSHTDHLDHAEKNSTRLLFLIKRNLHPLVDALEKNDEKLVRLDLLLHRRKADPIRADIRPAEPTTDTLLLLDLVRLKLETLAIATGITDIDLTAHGEKTVTEQLHLFAEKPPRDIQAANRALARLRAEFGDQAVLRVIPEEAHLPESRFSLQPLETLRLPEAEEPLGRPAIRRFFPAPIALHHEPKSLIRAGPHTISGGWWVRAVHRDYHLVETPDHRLLWVFYDHRRQRWYLHAEF